MKLDKIVFDGTYFAMSTLSATGAYLATYCVIKGDVLEGLGCAVISLIPLRLGSNILDNIRYHRNVEKEIKYHEDNLKNIVGRLKEIQK